LKKQTSRGMSNRARCERSIVMETPKDTSRIACLH